MPVPAPWLSTQSLNAAAFGFIFNFQDDQTHSQGGLEGGALGRGNSRSLFLGSRNQVTPHYRCLKLSLLTLPASILGAQHPPPPRHPKTPIPCTFFISVASQGLGEAEGVLG